MVGHYAGAVTLDAQSALIVGLVGIVVGLAGVGIALYIWVRLSRLQRSYDLLAVREGRESILDVLARTREEVAELSDGVLTLTLNRPEKLNSFNEAMHLALRSGLQRAHDEPAIRAVLLTGAGRGFSAGQDLGDRDPRRGGPPPDLGRTLDIYYNPTLRLIRSLDKPVICAVNGVAAGVGCSIALTCDLVVAKE